MLRRFLYLLVITFLCLNIKAQLLFHQENIKGGVNGDGVSYFGKDYLQLDTINFANFVPFGSSIKRAFLLSKRVLYSVGINDTKDDILTVNLNGNLLNFDSSAILTPLYITFFSSPTDENWIVGVDVTNEVVLSNNKLIIPCQSCLMIQDTSRHYVYVGFYLLIFYENNLMPLTNFSLFLNNKRISSSILYHFQNLNLIDVNSDIGLALWTDNVSRSNFGDYTSDYTLNPTLGNFYLGKLDMTLPNFQYSNTLPGSFDYNNNILYGLQDDTPDAFIDSTDALANIKTYLPAAPTSFSLTTTGNVSPGGTNYRNGFFLSYTSPCPASPSVSDTTVTLCKGQSLNLQAATTSSTASVSWYPGAGLNDSTIANPTATPIRTTNYIAYIKDTAGCMYTQHHKVIIHQAAVPDSVYVTNAICGGIQGSIKINPTWRDYTPFTYDIGNGPQSDTAFTNLSAGTYTLTITDNIGCTWQKSITITENNYATANISAYPLTGVVPLTTGLFGSGSSGVTNYNWYFPTDTLFTQNANYTFTQPGTYTVTLMAYNNDPLCFDTAKVIVIVEDSLRWTMPNVFSPNNDGINDQFIITPYYYETISYTIYDRWGKEVVPNAFDMTIKDNKVLLWDGMIAGIAASEGTYFYAIELKQKKTNQNPHPLTRILKGFVTLIR